MCGIFGIVCGSGSSLPFDLLRETSDRLFRLSESRGKESAGIAVHDGRTINVFKRAVPASRLIRSPEYAHVLERARAAAVNGGGSGNGHQEGTGIALMGHSRLVTNGVQARNDNNQPIIADGLVGVHNGIIVNDEALWRRFPTLRRHHEVDTEVILSLLRMFHQQSGSWRVAMRRTFETIEGCASVGVLFRDLDVLALATNNASLYFCRSEAARTCLFASEAYILRTLLRRADLRRVLATDDFDRFDPGEAGFIHLNGVDVERFRLGEPGPGTIDAARCETGHDIIDLSETQTASAATNGAPPAALVGADAGDRVELLHEDKRWIDELRRCRRCILPETFPFIEFDDEGVCSFCHGHEPIRPLGADALRGQVEPHRRASGEPDCLVGLSGGRDSCYGLHYIVRELGMHPIAYTYDWGMVTDLARRNISRMCAKLGVEHILISADIPRKRRFVRQNVEAWLKRPDLGMVPLFMAGDKQFYYFANKLRQRTGVDLFIFCAGNELEKTYFKTGFCGLGGGAAGGILTSLTLRNKIGLAAYYARQYLRNPRYVNASLADTVFAFFSSYMMPHDYHYLFHYVPWEEQHIMSVLRDEYDWELAGDTVATWRIGDGTAPFYNYIYHTVAGFTEYDTFRSNQVREGMLTREQALEIVRQENQPRYESLKWYFDAIRIRPGFNEIIETINAIPKLYPTAR